jgi:UDP-glucuronate 4-epimerase
MKRDFTYVDDIAAGVLRVLDKLPPKELGVQHRVYNIGNHKPEPLLRFIDVLAQALGKTPAMNMMPMQPGDVPATFADVAPLERDYGWKPTTPIEVGLPRFVTWYLAHYHRGERP